jgi:hypothetical protein
MAAHGGVGDRKLALERLETESKMDLSTELRTARVAYFEALDTGQDVRVRLRSLPLIHAPRSQRRIGESGKSVACLLNHTASESEQPNAAYESEQPNFCS